MRITVNSPLRDFLNKIYLELIETNVFKLDEKKNCRQTRKIFFTLFSWTNGFPNKQYFLMSLKEGAGCAFSQAVTSVATVRLTR
jgi:hypothetical protein